MALMMPSTVMLMMRPAPRDRGASGWEHPVSLIGHCPIFGHLAQRRAGYSVVVVVVIVVVTVIWSLRDSLYIPLPSIASLSFGCLLLRDIKYLARLYIFFSSCTRPSVRLSRFYMTRLVVFGVLPRPPCVLAISFYPTDALLCGVSS